MPLMYRTPYTRKPNVMQTNISLHFLLYLYATSKSTLRGRQTSLSSLPNIFINEIFSGNDELLSEEFQVPCFICHETLYRGVLCSFFLVGGMTA